MRPEYIRFCGRGALVAPPLSSDACLPHTPAPSGYLAWHAWAEEMDKTHKQQRCPGCGLLVLWAPKTDAPTDAP